MTDEEIFEFLRKQEEELLKEPMYYVHYDSTTKNITSFRNYLEETDSFPYVKFTKKDISESLEEFNIANYRIIVVNGKSTLKKYEPEDISISKIDDFIYEIPKIISDKRITAEDHPFDLLIEQNNSLKEFRIKLSKPLKEKYSLQSVGNQIIYIYVTALSDPNILYKTLKIPLNKLIKYEYYTIAFKENSGMDIFEGKEANIYAIRYFENYLHVDIRDDEISTTRT